MSNLLIHEEPLLVLPGLASKIGLNEAIFLQQIHYWLQRSNNVYDGYRWVYNTYEEWREQFPFWSVATLRRIVNKLEKEQLLIIGNYNKLKIDKTKWYRINYDLLNRMSSPCAQNEQSMCSDCAVDVLKMSRPLPETTTENTTEITTKEYIVEIVDYLNYVCGTKYKKDSEATAKLIKGRLKEFSVEDFKKVIDVKYAEWKGTSQAKYLRPKTLFNKTNFEGYLQQWELWKNGKTRGYNVGSYGKSADHVPEEVGRGIKPADNRGFAKTIG
ncbi:conserved phage C-terminal domain-containing protein [Bacillus cytotoxicus]|uniref:Phage conserved hypothetical protein C-terminal domain-containing protein n=1 Tax=Bacillus cytotoxicus TaxID=580165 RepID=A0AAX2CK83_9BACI|nr:conserved phage C-terminal domain-containing protein [Bacillus cytotoxicus]QTR83181.1 conserved phage C-terminal domain-containing protein [Bacillus cytotoxicus]QTR86918.1 conserved phage C-terminal domain-containing protein [Bacillus cytotoxicus]SCM00603.1 Uncharacterized protein BCB44BAC_03341 [Bacillus cytotoxicus]